VQGGCLEFVVVVVESGASAPHYVYLSGSSCCCCCCSCCCFCCMPIILNNHDLHYCTQGAQYTSQAGHVGNHLKFDGGNEAEITQCCALLVDIFVDGIH
jgi:hypothetical protein